MRILITITLISILISCNNSDVKTTLNFQDSFINLNKNIEFQNEYLDIKEKDYENGIMFSYAMDNENVRKYFQASQNVILSKNELILYILEIKKEIISLYDVNISYNDSFDLSVLKNENSTEITNNYFIKNNKASELKNEIKLYINSIKDELRNLKVPKGWFQSLNKIEELTTQDNNNWETSNFLDYNVTTVFTILTQIESQIRIIETDALSIIYEHINILTYKFDNIEPRLISIETVDKYISGEIILSAWSTSTPYKIIIGPASQLDTTDFYIKFKQNADTTQFKIKNGNSNFKIPRKKIGCKDISAIIEVKNTTTGEVKSYLLKDKDKYSFNLK
jgi:hypothetical protein